MASWLAAIATIPCQLRTLSLEGSANDSGGRPGLVGDRTYLTVAGQRRTHTGFAIMPWLPSQRAPLYTILLSNHGRSRVRLCQLPIS
jgi:hypothetical protein